MYKIENINQRKIRSTRKEKNHDKRKNGKTDGVI